MKTITMYELLGMMKDGKAPKKIRYNNVILYYDNENGDYYKYMVEYEALKPDRAKSNQKRYGNYLFSCLFHREYTNDFLNYPVEILEEEKKIPEKIRHDACWIYDDETNQLGKITLKDDLILNKLDEIIDYLKSKGDE